VARADAIEVEGAVVEVLSNRLYRVELANGHRVLAHLKGRARAKTEIYVLGERVKLEMSPFDLSTGGIMREEKQK
jgi:translation initiation factor IF-1